MNPNEMINGAMSVEEQGIPVNWKELAVKIFNSANVAMADLEKERNDLGDWQRYAIKIHPNLNEAIERLPEEDAQDGPRLK